MGATKRLVALTGLVAVLFLAVPALALDDCTVLFEGEDLFDLSPLYRSPDQESYRAVDFREDNKFVYYINICGPLTNKAGDCSSSDHVDDTASSCQTLRDRNAEGVTDDDRKKFPVQTGGKYDARRLDLIDSSDPHSGVRLVLHNEDQTCHNNQYARVTEIVFQCGPGTGAPVFVEESADCHYMFVWKTSHVCADDVPTHETECSVQDSFGNTYDLSDLSRADRNWMAVDSAEQDANVYYLNICSDLVADSSVLTDGCAEEGVSGCQLTGSDNPSLFSLGSSGSPKINSAGTIFVEMTGGTSCHVGTDFEAKRSAIIYFTCPQTGSVGLGHPVFREETEYCQYIFDWETDAACAAQETKGHDCKIKDSLGNLLDFTSIGDKVFNAISGDFELTMSLCGKIPEDQVCDGVDDKSNVGVCIVDSDSGSTMSFLPDSSLVLDDGDAFMTFTGTEPCLSDGTPDPALVTILLNCDRDAEPGSSHERLDYITRSDCSHLLVLSTSLACPPTSIDCTATGGGQTYDLSDLAKGDGNWKAASSDSDGYDYFLNVCQNINPGETGCSSSGGVCQLDKQSGVTYNLGKPQSPTVNEDGVLQIVYTDGTPCGEDKIPRKTTVTFTCAESTGVPRFEDEVSTCDYLFSWRTSAACPIGSQQGSDCTVEDKATGTLYDFTSLSEQSYSVTSESGKKYDIRLCEPSDSCSDGVAACEHNSGNSFGRASDAIKFNDGVITLDYKGGDKCTDGNPASTTIVFRCAPGRDGTDGPVLTGISGDCTLELEWATSLACTESFEPFECVTEDDDGNIYDLSSLVLATHNYHFEDDDHLYEINVCRPIVPLAGSDCPFGTAACQLPKDPSTSHHSKSLGVPSPPKWDSDLGRAYFEFLGGTGGCHGTYNRTTRIELVCPDKGEKQDFVFLGESDLDCTYRFQFITEAACKIRTIEGQGDCKLTDDKTGISIDLSALTHQSSDPYSVTAGEFLYELNVCGSVTCGSGSSDSGACQRKTDDGTFHKSLGKSSSKLVFRNNELTLEYKDGTPCHDETVLRSTHIIFRCDRDADLGEPKFVQELGSCRYIFEWRTALVCPQVLDCTALDPSEGHAHDLTILANSEHNWIASDSREGGKYEYELNVCRALVPKPDWDCGPFAAACQKVKDGRDYELGRPASPKIADDGTLYIEYEDGSDCDGVPRRTRIEFECLPEVGNLGVPQFMYEAQCEYTFRWKTVAACHDDDIVDPTEQPKGDCRAQNPITGDVFDLSNLSDDLSVEVHEGSDQYRYHVAVCDSVGIASTHSACEGSGACQTKIGDSNFAKDMGQSNANLQFVDGQLVLQYTDGEPCHDDTFDRETVLTFRCDPSATTPRLEFLEETQGCVYRFEVLTREVCTTAQTVECLAVDSATQHEFDLSSLIKTSDNWEVTGTEDEIVINVCRTLANTDLHCDIGAAACIRTGAGKVFTLGKLAEPTVIDGQPSLIYKGGVCPSDPSSEASVHIALECPLNGKASPPTLLDVTPDCEYVIVWDHPAACDLDRTTTTAKPGVTPGLDACVLEDALGHEYDLTPLAGKKFSAGDANKDENGVPYKYELSVCSNFQCGDKTSAACQSKGTSSWSMGSFTQAPQLSDGVITLKYTGGKPCHDEKFERTTTITFRCDKSAGEGRPVYRTETDECEYQFEWATAYACAPDVKQLECVVRDQATGKQYDFSVLSRSNEQLNWVAKNDDPDGTGESYEFLINVCKPLTPFPNMGQCLGASVCQTKPDDDSFSNVPAGLATSEPRLTKDSTFVLQYKLPGSYPKCHGQFHRSATITFTCRKGTLGQPVFVGETGDCEYLFEWATSAACGADRVEGHDCKVYDEVSGTSFDLTPLRDVGAVKVTAGHYRYEMAVCSALPEGCGDGFADPGGCQIDLNNDKQFPMGKFSQKLIYDDGHLSLEYTDGIKCHNNNFFRSMWIDFECDPTAGDDTLPEYVTEADDCTYFFSWKTKHACSGKEQVQCLVSDPQGKQYDLSVLTQFDDNWLVDNLAKADPYSYFINVCHNLIPTDDVSNCDVNSGACQVNSDGDLHVSLGQVAAPEWDRQRNGIVINMKGGSDELGCDKPRETTIVFKCKDDTETAFPLGNPVFYDETSKCHYEIHWETIAACHLDAKPALGCKLKDPYSGQVYDITSLGGLQSVQGYDGHTYNIDLCGHLEKGCGTHDADSDPVGACQHTTDNREFSLGKSRGLELNQDGNGLLMRFVGGDTCHNDKYHRSALVEITCGVSTDESLKFIGEAEDCGYLFTLTTPLVCPRISPKQCLVHDDKTGWDYDLSRLSKASGATRVKAGNLGDIYINVCSPAEGAGCGSDYGSCLATKNGEHLGLGSYADTKPMVTPDGKTILVYSDGQDCPNSGGTARTEIVFKCEKDKSRQTPSFLDVKESGSHCTYRIEWPTCAVCTGHNPCDDVAPVRTTTQRSPTQPGGTDPTGPTKPSKKHGSGTDGGVVAAVVIILILVVGISTFLLMKPERRARLMGLCGMKPVQPQYRYEKLGLEGGSLSDTARLFEDGDDDDDDEENDGDIHALSGASDGAGAADPTSYTIDDDDSEDDDTLLDV